MNRDYSQKKKEKKNRRPEPIKRKLDTYGCKTRDMLMCKDGERDENEPAGSMGTNFVTHFFLVSSNALRTVGQGLVTQ